jgi:small subunit ribosomal protein S10e
MLKPKKNLVAIYNHLFTEGVIVAMKVVHAPKHPGKDFTYNNHECLTEG